MKSVTLVLLPNLVIFFPFIYCNKLRDISVESNNASLSIPTSSPLLSLAPTVSLLSTPTNLQSSLTRSARRIAEVKVTPSSSYISVRTVVSIDSISSSSISAPLSGTISHTTSSIFSSLETLPKITTTANVTKVTRVSSGSPETSISLPPITSESLPTTLHDDNGDPVGQIKVNPSSATLTIEENGVITTSLALILTASPPELGVSQTEIKHSTVIIPNMTMRIGEIKVKPSSTSGRNFNATAQPSISTTASSIDKAFQVGGTIIPTSTASATPSLSGLDIEAEGVQGSEVTETKRLRLFTPITTVVSVPGITSPAAIVTDEPAGGIETSATRVDEPAPVETSTQDDVSTITSTNTIALPTTADNIVPSLVESNASTPTITDTFRTIVTPQPPNPNPLKTKLVVIVDGIPTTLISPTVGRNSTAVITPSPKQTLPVLQVTNGTLTGGSKSSGNATGRANNPTASLTLGRPAGASGSAVPGGLLPDVDASGTRLGSDLGMCWWLMVCIGMAIWI